MCSRDYNVQCLASHFPVLGHNIQYTSDGLNKEPEDRDQDQDISISTQDDEAHVLRRECRKWAIRVAREAKAINDLEKRLSALKEKFCMILFFLLKIPQFLA